MIFLCIIGIVFIAIYGAASIFSPETVWKWEHFMDVKNGEPTDWYIEKSRLKGIFLLVADIFIVLLLIGII